MAERNERVGRTYWLLHFRCTAWANGRSLFDRRSRRSGIWRFTLWWVCWRDWLLMWPSFFGYFVLRNKLFCFSVFGLITKNKIYWVVLFQKSLCFDRVSFAYRRERPSIFQLSSTPFITGRRTERQAGGKRKHKEERCYDHISRCWDES